MLSDSCGMCALSFAAAVLVGGCSIFKTEIPAADVAGFGGAKARLLVLSDSHAATPIDAKYRESLEKEGFEITTTTHEHVLPPGYFDQFGAVILTEIPAPGDELNPVNYAMKNVATNCAMLLDYVRRGGGLVIEPELIENGGARAWNHERMLPGLDAEIKVFQMKGAGASLKNDSSYGTGRFAGGHPITDGLLAEKKDAFLYPQNTLRWDGAISTTPIAFGKDWTVLASADAGAKGWTVVANIEAAEPTCDVRTLAGIRDFGKGKVVLSGINSFYTLHSCAAKRDCGEQATGVIDYITLYGRGMRDEGRGNRGESFYGDFLSRAFRYLAANAAENGLGADKGLVAGEEPVPGMPAKLDWSTLEMPKAWQHRVFPRKTERGWFYDDMTDPSRTGEIRPYKFLVGARTSLSSGRGTVAEFAAAAKKAGYDGICFTETLVDLPKERFEELKRQCAAASTDDFKCLSGLELENPNGQHALAVGLSEYPTPSNLSPDRKLVAARLLSMGSFGKTSVITRPATSIQDYRMFKHFQGIAVATYGSDGQLVDDGLEPYLWQVESDSNPFPFAIHEVAAPEDVAKATAGYQQIVPAETLDGAVYVLQTGFPRYFDCPVSTYVSEGPVLADWTIFNKDIGPADLNRDRFRLCLSLHSPTPTRNSNSSWSVDLYDGQKVFRHWTSTNATFAAMVDDRHGQQRMFALVAKDKAGRRLVAPQIRTVTGNSRFRCGDRQNWLGTLTIYTGWSVPWIPNWGVPTADRDPEWNNQRPILDFPFAGNHALMQEIDATSTLMMGCTEDIAGDGKGMLPMRKNRNVQGRMRYLTYNPVKNGGPGSLEAEIEIEFLRDATLPKDCLLAPTISFTSRASKLIVNGVERAKPAKGEAVDLPVGSFAYGLIALETGLAATEGGIGWRAPASGFIPAGTVFRTRVATFLPRRYYFYYNQRPGTIDPIALDIVNECGFGQAHPLAFTMTQGSFDSLAYLASFTAKDGGIAGTCAWSGAKPSVMNAHLRIAGLRRNTTHVLWRADGRAASPLAAAPLEAFGDCDGTGYVSLDPSHSPTPTSNSNSFDFYAGDVLVMPEGLAAELVEWTKDAAVFRLNNPLAVPVTGRVATPAAVKGFKQGSKDVTVAPGASVEVRF